MNKRHTRVYLCGSIYYTAVWVPTQVKRRSYLIHKHNAGIRLVLCAV